MALDTSTFCESVIEYPAFDIACLENILEQGAHNSRNTHSKPFI